MKSLERQLQEKQEEIDRLKRKSSGRTNDKKVDLLELSESGLPPAAQARLRKRFEAAGTIVGLREAIAAERDYVKKVRASKNSQGAQDLVAAYRALGLTEKESGIAANVEAAVEQISESRQKLLDAAKLLGMNGAEADAFSRI